MLISAKLSTTGADRRVLAALLRLPAKTCSTDQECCPLNSVAMTTTPSR
jgi:hypothetical protein